MSRSSKVVLGLSVVLTAATVAGVHVKQRLDQQVGFSRVQMLERLYPAVKKAAPHPSSCLWPRVHSRRFGKQKEAQLLLRL
ncbi:protein PET117 homolog, mitochondrial isoform X2 [Camelus bactrianus]|uniref:Protein PET117 homolog, mitochondrial isoform X2 n=1 Tax=Camelus bactrianus TaxID=9837 RepID=A0AC58P1N3_CAMBA